MPKRVRDYRDEYDRYHALPHQKKNRAKRNAARAMLQKEGVVKKGDGMEVHHKNPIRNGGGNGRSNLAKVTLKSNRGWRGKTK